MAFSINILFKSYMYGVIFRPQLLSWLHDELSMHIRDSNGFFSTRLVCRDRDTCSSYKATDLLLFLLKYNVPQKLPVFFFLSADLALFCHT